MGSRIRLSRRGRRLYSAIIHKIATFAVMEVHEFITSHLNENTDKLLLNAAKHPEFDMLYVVDQILARRHIREKLPQWFMQERLVFPSRIAAEQCSSETTARYKQRLITGKRVCDLTGGLGIDSWYFAQQAEEVIYIERYDEYCRVAESNFRLLNAHNIRVLHGDSTALAETLSVDTFYIDPARRADSNKRLFALSDCEPNILQLKPVLLEHATRVVVKISPMADISETLRLLPETTEVHILSVRNECKELLFVLGQGYNPAEVNIHAVNFNTAGSEEHLTFQMSEETDAALTLATTVEQYLYEPNASVLKSGAFKLTGERYGCRKLHQHSHLYTSQSPVESFPGRSFKIICTHRFSGKLLKQLSGRIAKAHITTRNFPLTVAELRKRSGITEGGDIYLFATTLSGDEKVIIECKKREYQSFFYAR